ncbi:hypothetical protein RDABS01_018835 [Bienertia sinuspersici]
MEAESVDWSELCPEILLEIADRLGTRPNVFNFRQVCKNWRFSLSYIPRTLPQISPLFPHRFFARDSDFFSSLSGGTLHHLVAEAVYLLRPRKSPESSKAWLVTVEEFYRGKLCVRLPLSKIIASEYLSKKVRFSKTLNLSDFHVSVIARGYSIRAPEIKPNLSANGGLACKNKLVLFANPDAIEPLSINDYTGLVWFDHGRVSWVRLARPSNWGFLDYNGISKFDDIVNFKGRVYGVDRTGKLYAINYDLEWINEENYKQTLRLECIVNDSISSGRDGDRRKRLVVDSSSGELYMIEMVAYWCFKTRFKVYKLNEESSKLDKVVGIGDDRILFVGVDWCFFASSADFSGCKGNCMIFSEESFSTYDGGMSAEMIFIRSARSELVFSVYFFEDRNAGPISKFPVFSDLLWPPPVWFLPEKFMNVADECHNYSGVLYLVEMVAYLCFKTRFKVYKFNEESSKLDKVAGIGDDRILFVGVDWCFFASAADFSGCKGNCIIFSEESFSTYDGGMSAEMIFIRSARSELVFSAYFFEDRNAGPMSKFPVFSDLLWPPPVWFLPDSLQSENLIP